MPGKLKITGNIKTPRDPINVKAYCEGRAFAKAGGTIVQASAVTGLVASNNAIKWTSKIPGNGMQVVIANPGVNSAPLTLSVSGILIQVSLATNGSGVATTTATLLLAAVAANAAANAIVGVANEGASTGAGVVTVESAVLSGSNFNNVASEMGVAYAAGVTSWTADPAGVQTQDCCALPYGGGHI